MVFVCSSSVRTLSRRINYAHIASNYRSLLHRPNILDGRIPLFSFQFALASTNSKMAQLAPAEDATIVVERINQTAFKVTHTPGLSGRDFLLQRQSGAYSTMRTLNSTAILELDIHLQRLKDTLPVACPALKVDASNVETETMAMLRHCIATYRDRFGGGEMKITVLAHGDQEGMRMVAHVCPLPQLHLDAGIQVEFHGAPRQNAHAKNSDWVREREEKIKKQDERTHEVVLIDHEGRLYEGLSSNFYVIHNDAVCTAPLDAVLPGTVLKQVALCCQQSSIPMRYEFPRVDAMRQWQAAMISSTSRGLVPIHTVLYNGEKLEIPSLSCELLQRIQKGLKASLQERATPVQ